MPPSEVLDSVWQLYTTQPVLTLMICFFSLDFLGMKCFSIPNYAKLTRAIPPLPPRSDSGLLMFKYLWTKFVTFKKWVCASIAAVDWNWKKNALTYNVFKYIIHCSYIYEQFPISVSFMEVMEWHLSNTVSILFSVRGKWSGKSPFDIYAHSAEMLHSWNWWKTPLLFQAVNQVASLWQRGKILPPISLETIKGCFSESETEASSRQWKLLQRHSWRDAAKWSPGKRGLGAGGWTALAFYLRRLVQRGASLFDRESRIGMKSHNYTQNQLVTICLLQNESTSRFRPPPVIWLPCLQISVQIAPITVHV